MYPRKTWYGIKGVAGSTRLGTDSLCGKIVSKKGLIQPVFAI